MMMNMMNINVKWQRLERHFTGSMTALLLRLKALQPQNVFELQPLKLRKKKKNMDGMHVPALD